MNTRSVTVGLCSLVLVMLFTVIELSPLPVRAPPLPSVTGSQMTLHASDRRSIRRTEVNNTPFQSIVRFSSELDLTLFRLISGQDPNDNRWSLDLCSVPTEGLTVALWLDPKASFELQSLDTVLGLEHAPPGPRRGKEPFGMGACSSAARSTRRRGAHGL